MRQAATSPKQKLAGLQAHDLQDAKRQAAERFQTIAQDILDAAGVQHIDYHDKGLRGKAWGKQKRVLVPWPTTRRRLYVVAHEAGHVAMGHARTKAHREEYEAEKYAHDALRKHGVAVPAESTRQAKDYVAWKIHQAIRRGAKAIDRQALEWCRDYWTEETKRWLTEQ
jgi:RES domain-containing protein